MGGGGGRVARSLVFCVAFRRSLFDISSFFQPLWVSLSFDLRILNTSLVSSDSSYMYQILVSLSFIDVCQILVSLSFIDMCQILIALSFIYGCPILVSLCFIDVCQILISLCFIYICKILIAYALLMCIRFQPHCDLFMGVRC